MLLGSGEFSRELAIALQRLGTHVIAAERYADAPAHGVADDFEAQLEAARKRAAMIEQDLNAPSSSTVASPLSVRIRDLATEGRKAFVRGELLDGDTLLAEANGLMVRLLPGQP